LINIPIYFLTVEQSRPQFNIIVMNYRNVFAGACMFV